MAVQLKLRRDTATDLALATPVEAEPGYDQTNKRLIVGDGVRAGGIPHAAFHDVQNSAFSYAAATGTDTLTASLSPAPAAYVAGQSFKIKAASTNTGAVTIDINALGARNVKKMGDSGKEALEAGDIVAGGIYTLDYDGSEFIISGGVGQKSGMVLIDTQSANGASAIEFVTGIGGTYSQYVFYVDRLSPDTNGENLNIQFRSSSTWQASLYSRNIMTFGDGSVSVSSSDSNTSILIADSVSSASTVGFRGVLHLQQPSEAVFKQINFDGAYQSSSGTVVRYCSKGTGMWTGSTNPVDGVRFLAPSGNVSGTIRLYGLRT